MLTKIAPEGAAANFGISISIFRQRISSAVIPHPCLSDGAKGPTTFAAAGSRTRSARRSQPNCMT